MPRRKGHGRDVREPGRLRVLKSCAHIWRQYEPGRQFCVRCLAFTANAQTAVSDPYQEGRKAGAGARVSRARPGARPAGGNV